jgi:dienelactone hydrolase
MVMGVIFSSPLRGRLNNSIFAICSFLILAACSGPPEAALKVVNYQDPIAEECIADPVNKYHILVPGNPDQWHKIPLVIVLDAHGDGKLAVEKFQPAVQFFPCIVAGSDLIKNNFPGYETSIIQMMSDIENKYPVDAQKIIIAGFSGGARMAYYFSLNHPVKAVLMCGAGPGKEKPACPVYAISGMGDFNFAEQYQHPDIQSINDNKFTSDYFYGTHEWPQPQQLSDGIVFLLRDDNDMENIRRKRSHDLMQLADSLDKTGDNLMAWKALEKAAKFSVDKSKRDKAVERAESLIKKGDFQQSINSLEADLKTEAGLNQEYAQRSLTENFNWWKKELTALNDDLETYKTGLKADHYLRIKGFIGILLYTRINKMIYGDARNPQLPNLLETYAFAEPENSQAWYFKALHAYQSGDQHSCIENLEKSLKLGFTDLNKMRSDLPENILIQAGAKY